MRLPYFIYLRDIPPAYTFSAHPSSRHPCTISIIVNINVAYRPYTERQFSWSLKLDDDDNGDDQCWQVVVHDWETLIECNVWPPSRSIRLLLLTFFPAEDLRAGWWQRRSI